VDASQQARSFRPYPEKRVSFVDSSRSGALRELLALNSYIRIRGDKLNSLGEYRHSPPPRDVVLSNNIGKHQDTANQMQS
jgi:hypothetical protein